MIRTHIAIVEDDADDREFISMSLDNVENIEISMYHNGQDFMEFMKNNLNYPDLIITDIRMPFATGFDVIKAIKQRESTKNIPVVVLSTSSSKEDMKLAKELGAIAYYIKPYNLDLYRETTDAIVESFQNSFLKFSTVVKHFLHPKAFDFLI